MTLDEMKSLRRVLDHSSPQSIITLANRDARTLTDAAARFRGLRELCGHVENGSDTFVTVFQDDATRDWTVKVGNKRYYAATLEGAMDAAIGSGIGS